MFSGIVEKLGTLKESRLEHKWGRIAVEAQGWEDEVAVGDSVAVQGICLTVADKKGDWLYFDVLKETFERTTLGRLTPGARINLERALRWGQPMGGHIVIGHVDGIGYVQRIEPVGRDRAFTIRAEGFIMESIVYKGSIAVDGVSLTIAGMSDDHFTVHIIPYTMEMTTFGTLAEGDAVNLEVDILAKYVRRLVERGRLPWHIDWQDLQREGLIAEPLPERGTKPDRR